MPPKFRRDTIDAIDAADATTKKLDKDDNAACVAAHNVRKLRRTQLDIRAEAIKRATDRYEILDQGENPEIRIRRSFVRLDTGRPPQEDDSWPATVREKLRADIESRPPLTKLNHRPSHAAQVYLSLIFVAQLEFEPGVRWVNERDNNGRDGWGELSGLLAPSVLSKELNLRVTRALAKLADHDLVRVGERGSRSRFDGFTLHREDERQTYFAPSPSESRSLPVGFFTAGWHLVLTNDEMATLLAIIEQTAQPRARKDAAQVGVALPQSVRWRFYGLSPEAFASRHELEEFGLIEMFDPMDRTDGKLSDSQRKAEMRAPRLTLKLDGFDFSRPAIEVVRSKLARPVPPRMVSRARRHGLLDDAGTWREPGTP
jgi:hypothetical protein